MSDRALLGVVLPPAAPALSRAQTCMPPALGRGLRGKENRFCERHRNDTCLCCCKKDFVQFSLSGMWHNMAEEIALMKICLKVFLSNKKCGFCSGKQKKHCFNQQLGFPSICRVRFADSLKAESRSGFKATFRFVGFGGEEQLWVKPC